MSQVNLKLRLTEKQRSNKKLVLRQMILQISTANKTKC